jgi:hypothetical protein
MNLRVHDTCLGDDWPLIHKKILKKLRNKKKNFEYSR